MGSRCVRRSRTNRRCRCAWPGDETVYARVTVPELRPLLFSIAYRMLGSVAEAEDVVQEAFLRRTTTATTPENERAFMIAVTTRIAIDVLRSARVRREAYVGW